MATVLRPGNTAVITGGASGIGLALARRCRAAGMRVLIADWDAAALQAAPANTAISSGSSGGAGEGTTGSEKEEGGSVSTVRIDVGKLADWDVLKAKVEEDLGGKIHLLALNAGVGGPSSWSDPSSFRRILDTNLYGVINGITSLLPLVQATASSSSSPPSSSSPSSPTTAPPAASIIITGSKQGITNPPGNPAYNASKAAVRTLAEHLSWDLRDSSPPISVHLLVPGWTFTGISGKGYRPDLPNAEQETKKPAGAWWPEQVVGYLEGKMAEGKFYVICPDNDVSEATDRKRVLWTAGDLVEGRPPLTRWRGEEWKAKAQAWMDSQP